MTMLDTRTGIDAALHQLNQAHTASRWQFRTLNCDDYGNASIVFGCGSDRLVVFHGNDGTVACTDDHYNLVDPDSVGIDAAACAAVLAEWPAAAAAHHLVATAVTGDDRLYARHDGWVDTPGLGWETR